MRKPQRHKEHKGFLLIFVIFVSLWFNSAMKTMRIVSISAVLAVVFLAGACSDRNSSTTGLVISQPTSTLATLEDQGQLPDFSLINQNGRTVTLSDLKGQVWVADFFFSHCKGACPM